MIRSLQKLNELAALFIGCALIILAACCLYVIMWLSTDAQ